MAPEIANFIPTFEFSNFGHKIPGVSNNSISSDKRIHCLPLVTPGLLPVTTTFFPNKVLIKVLFPTLGMPTIIARIVTFLAPLFSKRVLFS